STRLLPLFPLPLVLFPGTPLPLHIFEPRYRRLLADCLAGDRQFGVLHRPDGAAEADLPPGHVGCIATVNTVHALPDGRSNVLVDGTERFRLLHLADAADVPYQVGEVEPYEDIAEDATLLADVGARLRTVFERVARAARTIADEGGDLPDLPEDPALISFAIAAMIDLDADARQQLLASRSALERLRVLEQLLQDAIPGLDERARVHVRARGNGHGPGGHA
ncbi:MAG TPA: LON peptidase substrate-binding domain-containing protein, partial [Gemmatimonadaceae bacterium]|nr:LON peptidase substrate-binding domain-containing protein [Gemmatimonadaceae bacterium]